MLREKSTLITQIHKTLDIGITASAFICAYFIKRLILPEPFRGVVDRTKLLYRSAPGHHYLVPDVQIVPRVRILQEAHIPRHHNIFGPEGAWNDGREKAPAAICRKVTMSDDGGEIEITDYP